MTKSLPQFIMTYQSTFGFESAHLNGPDEYAALNEIITALVIGSPHVFERDEIVMKMLRIMEGTHGHNFSATFFLGLTPPTDRTLEPVSYLIDDVVLSGIVHRYNRTNVSILPGLRLLRDWQAGSAALDAKPSTIIKAFEHRATTENLARDMLAELVKVLRMTWVVDEVGFAGDLCARVTVTETPGISASAEAWLQNVMPDRG